MGILNWLGIGKDIAEPINAVSNLYTTDKARLEAEANLTDMLSKIPLEQLHVNKELLKTGRFFDSGWQPLLGWTSGFLVLLYWGPQLVVANYIWIMECVDKMNVLPFPVKPDDIMNLVWLLFGFGGYSLIKQKFIR